jgi:hypothetical protein
VNPLDALWHLGNLFLPAWGVAVFQAAGVKLLWRQQSRGLAWRRLALWGGLGGSVGVIAALLLLGRDGRMAGYGLMLLGISLPHWWLLRR